jgi:hypothetical protein
MCGEVPVMDLNRVCEVCGERFYQYRGRPAKRCSDCRGGDRYGSAHRAMRAATVDQAVGRLCVRCQQPMLEGQAVQLDHADNGDPNAYVGYSHRSCNARAGAVAGNKARAAAYRAAKGLPAQVTVSASANGAGLARARVATDDHDCVSDGCHAEMAVCACRRHSRPW